MSDENEGSIGCLGGIAVLALCVYSLYFFSADNPRVPAEIDSSGYISHEVEATITAQSTWMVGESKECLSYPLDSQSARALGKEPGYAFHYVKCDEGPERKIRVRFYGAENQPGKFVAYWKCTRTSASFVCKQIGAD